MNKNLLGIGIIAALTVLIVYFVNLNSIQRPSQKAKSDHWAEQAKTAPENFFLICPPSQDGKPISPDQCKRQGQYEYDRQQQMLDHRAQVSMKNAAWAGFVLGIIGMVLLAWTLIETRKAASFTEQALGEAKDATKAAWAAVDVTRVVGQKQVRAYIGFENAEWYSSAGHLFVDLSVKNYGNSPCISGNINAEITVQIPIDENGEEIPTKDRLFKIKASHNGFFEIIKPDGVHKALLVWDFKGAMPENMFDAPNWPNTAIWFYFNLTWVDVFGETQKVLMRCHTFNDSKISELIGADKVNKMEIYHTKHFDEKQ